MTTTTTTTTTTTGPPRQRRSLRQNFKHLLRFISTCPHKAQTIGSGILRRGGDISTSSYSPSIPPATASLFPAFGSDQCDPDIQARDHEPATFTPTTSASLLSSESTSHSLLPATSLSHFDLRRTYLRHARPPQHAVLASVDDAYRDGASYRASVATLAPSTCARSVSTLRLKPSFAASVPDSATLSLETLSTLFTASDSSATTTTSHHSNILSEKHYLAPRARNEARPRRPKAHSSQWDPFSVVKHFQSFCVLDTAVPGAPVTATSAELQYIFDIGEQFFLNNQECKEASMDLVMGSDAAGNQVTHLVLFSPLVSPSSGRSRFLLAALVDVTEFINEAASLSEDASIGEQIATPPRRQRQPLSASALHPWKPKAPPPLPAAHHQLSAEDLLGGCYISDPRPAPPRRERRQADDIWLDLAARESRPKPNTAGARCAHAQRPQTNGKRAPVLSAERSRSSSSSPTTTATDASSVDDVLDQFVASLQSLYADFFLLGRNPLDDRVYEICYVSPKFYAGKEYANGHLSNTSRQAIAELSFKLARGDAFCQRAVRWGARGELKKLYCIPLYGQNSLTWICFLVDDQLPTLW